MFLFNIESVSGLIVAVAASQINLGSDRLLTSSGAAPILFTINVAGRRQTEIEGMLLFPRLKVTNNVTL
jgi:hypothetical protein